MLHDECGKIPQWVSTCQLFHANPLSLAKSSSKINVSTLSLRKEERKQEQSQGSVKGAPHLFSVRWGRGGGEEHNDLVM